MLEICPLVTDKTKYLTELDCLSKRLKVNLNCPHMVYHHYARGKCVKCYNKDRSSKKATLCKHTDRPLYARGLCISCYQSRSRARRREARRDEEAYAE